MHKYLTACDLDNTLLTSKKTIKFKSRRFIKKYQKKGNFFVICTGRPFSGAIQYYNQLPKGMPMITDNGGSIYYPNKNGFKKVTFNIKQNIIKEMLNEIEKDILNCCCTIDNIIYVQNLAETPHWIIHGAQIKEGILIDILDKDPILFNLWLKEGTFEHFEEVAKKYSNDFSYRYWGLFTDRHSIEIHPVNASKGNAMKLLAKELGADITCSFGDQWNDLSMIEAADVGVAMINAVDRIKNVAKFHTTKDHNHNGVVDFIKKNKLY